MQPSPLQLDGYYLKEANFNLTHDLKGMPEGPVKLGGVNIDIKDDAVPQTDDLLKWRCEVRIRSTNPESPDVPYSFSIVYVGFFEIAPDYPEEKRELLARVNAPALLYSAARETMLSLSGRSPYPAIILPSVTFLSPPDKVRPSTPPGKQVEQRRKAGPKARNTPKRR